MRFKIICDCGNKMIRMWSFNNKKKFVITCGSCGRQLKGECIPVEESEPK